MSDIACTEGDDTQEAPIRVVLFGSQFAAVNNVGLPDISMSGPGCLSGLAKALLSAGISGDRQIALFRGGEAVGRTTIAEAAHDSAS